MFELVLSKEELDLIENLCDYALRQGGLKNLNPVINTLNAIGKAVEVEEKSKPKTKSRIEKIKQQESTNEA